MSDYYWLTYPAAYRDLIKPLLHQQMWLFGQDIISPQGNLLYQYQFSHQRAEKRGGSMYTLWQGEQQIVLWGWGIWYGQAERGGIFVNRFKAKPRFSAEPYIKQPIHKQDALPITQNRVDSALQAESVRQMWADLLHWLANYEQWILNEFGQAWRRAALKPFPHAYTKPSAIEQLANDWQTLAEQSHTLPIRSYTQ